MNADIIKKANDLVNAASEGYVAVMDADGYPHCATRSVRNADGIFSCYFTSGTGGNLANSIEHNGKASVCFRAGNGNVTLIGDFEIVTDRKTKQEVWVDWFINHYPGGADDPIYFVAKFVAKRVSLWLDREYAVFDISDIQKPQSRCGLLCAGCSYKESHGCGGCLETMGHPFHGECPVAVCAQEKGYVHCGQCPDMPCDNLYKYSCEDEAHGDKPKGARLEMLKYWSVNGWPKNSR